MKKTTRSGSGTVSRVLLSGAGAAFLTGGVAEAGLNNEAHIYSDVLNQTFTALGGGQALNIGFILGTDFQFRMTLLPDHKYYDLGLHEVGFATILASPQAGDFSTKFSGEMMGLDLRIRDWTAGTLIDFRIGAFVNAEVLGPANHFASDLDLDEWIGAGAGQFWLDGAVVKVPTPPSPTPFSSPGYVGFVLKDGGGAPGSDYYYGWLEITEIDLSGPTASITVGGYGIRTVAGVGIRAGDTGSTSHRNPAATPEPATTGLALLALGAAGVMRHRRRREAVA